ncbi:CCA tRNA nucleotidyltransferase [Sphingomonas cannabina]|uniref:CCA tRNA nucleotidyltransferase n=1 Tax=Sphingomonas cannabina TaxID=2899123 RepID=UPI001F1FD859|nr:CCA tRNA nucleotidyltransferase [Sphingomonas cannabina]UIJ47082.1 CCA tRNA nucleotidyltransferase [Sphingomonas cannabina]
MVTLPDAEWRDRAGLDRLAEVLGAGEGMARFVGGAVRDALLGIPVADLDVATRHAPATVIDLLRRAGIKAVPTGIDHGTVTAVIESGPVEVTTLRRDVSTDGRRATVAFTDDWREDAARRDFTINALYADPATGEVFDYFGGLADLEARRIRFIGDPLQRIAEDHLRILRFFRFLARFGDAPDAAGLEACAARANDLMALSRERIRDELLKLLAARDAVRVVRLMLDRGILKPVLPEIVSADRLEALASREDAAGITPAPLRRLVALLPAEAVEEVGARLKLSNAERKRIVSAAQPAGDRGVYELAYRLGTEGAVDRLLLSDRPVEEVCTAAAWSPPALPITGGALVARGLRRGPEVARVLREIENRWIAEDFPDAARVDVIAEEAVAQALRSASSA